MIPWRGLAPAGQRNTLTLASSNIHTHAGFFNMIILTNFIRTSKKVHESSNRNAKGDASMEHWVCVRTRLEGRYMQ